MQDLEGSLKGGQGAVVQEVDFAPAAPDRWPQVERLFRSCGDARGCWCGFWYRPNREFRVGWGDGNRLFFEALIEGGMDRRWHEAGRDRLS